MKRKPLEQEVIDKIYKITGFKVADKYGDIIERDGQRFRRPKSYYEFFCVIVDNEPYVELAEGIYYIKYEYKP